MGRVIWQKESIEADSPYYAYLADLNIWNLEEMKYYFERFFYLIEKDFYNESLIRFLSEDLKRPDLGRMISLSRGKSDPVIITSKLIISMGDESEEKQNFWRQKASEYARLPEAFKQLKKADTLYEMEKFARAEESYKEILKKQNDGILNLTNEEIGKICYRLAFISLESLSWKSAGSYLQEAYGLLGYEAILKELYILSCMSPEVLCDGTLFHEISPRTLRDWQQEYERKKEAFQNKYALSYYEQLSMNSLGEEGNESAADLLKRWQSDYRKICKNSCQENDFSV